MVLWLAAGVRPLDPDRELAVLDGPLPGLPRRVEGRLAVAPPGLLRLSRYSRQAVELPLPTAADARLAGADGGLYGLRGWATVQPRVEDWRELHAAARGGGLGDVLRRALRDAAIEIPRRTRHQRRVPATRAEWVEQRLAESLRRHGAELRRLQLDGFDVLTAEAPQPPSGARVLVIGLDGADWELIDPLIAEDRLPNLARLIDEGVRAPLLSVSPTLSPVVWTTVATGVEPSRHGILDFLVPNAEGVGEPVTARDRRVAAVWQILSRAGLRCGVVGWWASWPAEPVEGYLVSDRIAYQLFGYRADLDDPQGKVWPAELYEEVRGRIVEPGSVAFEELQGYLSGERRSAEAFSEDERERLEGLSTLIASGRTYIDLDLWLAERFEPDFEALYLEGTDTVGHLFMGFRPPRLPGVPAASFDSFHEVVDRYYETVDAELGRLLEGRGEDWTVVILSDHGFLSGEQRPRTTDSRIGHGAAADWHRRFGMLVLSGAHIRPGLRLEQASVYDVAPTLLALFGQPVPISWPGTVLAEAIDPAFLASHPVRYRLDDPQRFDAGTELLAGPDPSAEELKAKLESLGYLGGGGAVADASMPSTRNNRAVALLAEGRFAEAEAELRKGLEEQPEHPTMLLNLAVALTEQGRAEEARPLLEQALHYRVSRRAAGIQLGRLALARGDLDEAERSLRDVLQREPGAAAVRTTLGMVLEQRGDLDAAAKEYAEAARLDPHAALPRNLLGTLARDRGRLDEAEAHFRAAIAADPYFMGPYNNLALVYQDQGRNREAADLYRRALERSPENVIVLNNLASLHYAEGGIEDARRLWRRCVAAAPGYAAPHNNLAGILIAEGKAGEAEPLLRRAIEIDPGYGDAHINLSLIRRGEGRLEEARSELVVASRDPASRANALTQLGILALDAGEALEARQHLLEAVLLAPRDVNLLNALGEAHHRLGQSDEALSVWQRSLALRPEQPNLERRVDQVRM